MNARVCSNCVQVQCNIACTVFVTVTVMWFDTIICLMYVLADKDGTSAVRADSVHHLLDEK